MPDTCVSVDWNARWDKNILRSYQKFPKHDKELREKWIQAVGHDNWVPSALSKLCSDHFTEDCFITKPEQKGHFLKKGSVPTIFPAFPSYLQTQEPKTRKSPRKRIFKSPEPEGPSPSKVTQTIKCEHAYTSAHSPAKKAKILQKTLKETWANLEVTQARVQRQKKKIKTMHDLLTSLKDKELITTEQQKFWTITSLVLQRSWLRVILQMQKCSQIWTATQMRSSNLQWNSITTHQRHISLYARYWNCSTDQEFSTGLHLWTVSWGTAQMSSSSLDWLLKQIIQWQMLSLLLMPAMAVHKVTFWDPKNWQYVGNMNYGTAVPDACENPAIEALVFLAAGLRGFWKHSIAYVLQDKCSAKV